MAETFVGDGGGCWKTKAFCLQVISGRWFMVFASLLIMAMSGATYMFGLYSNVIKTSMGYDQTTLNILSFSKDMGANVGVLSGLINEVTPPWVVVSMGALMNFFGYFMMWLAVTGHTNKPKLWQMCLYICIGASSQTFANTGVLVTCVMNFTESRGSVLGLLKGYVGLSGAIMTQLYHLFYGEDDSKSLILFIAWLPTVVSVAFLRTIRIINTSLRTKELEVFYHLLYISLGLAGFLMCLIIIQNKLEFNKIEYIGNAMLISILLFLPIVIVIREEYYLYKNKLRSLTSNDSCPVKPLSRTPTLLPVQPTRSVDSLAGGPKAIENQPSCIKNIFHPPNRGEDYTILQALFSVDMLILFITTTCGAGGTLTAIDNMGQIGSSQGYSSRSTTTFISLISIWGYLGRALTGFASEMLLTSYKIPRPLLLTFVLLFSCIGHLLIAFDIPNSLYISSVIIGFCFGAQWPLLFAIISEIFGLKYYSTLYNFGGAASPVGLYILNVRVTGYLYDKEALKQMEELGLKRETSQDLTCRGTRCYKMAFLIITAATLLSCLVSIVLVLRTWKFYKGDIYKKYRKETEVEETHMDSSLVENSATVTEVTVEIDNADSKTCSSVSVKNTS